MELTQSYLIDLNDMEKATVLSKSLIFIFMNLQFQDIQSYFSDSGK